MKQQLSNVSRETYSELKQLKDQLATNTLTLDPARDYEDPAAANLPDDLTRERARLPFLERQIGTLDSVGVDYLEQGVLASRAVCKLHARDRQGHFTGTAFLISDRLLLTNEHNLESDAIARSGIAEFDHQIGPNGRPLPSKRFLLRPEEAYWKDRELDVCVVAVDPLSERGEPLTEFGYLNLDPRIGKIEEGQFVTLVHHGDGDWKRVSLRENRLVKKGEQVLWYASDTATGSSGAPAFSDEWKVVAVHRRGVPRTKDDDENMIQLRNGEFMSREDVVDLGISDRDIEWIANEGARVSVLFDRIRNSAEAENPLIAQWLRRTITQDGRRETVAGRDRIVVRTSGDVPDFVENRRPVNDYETRNGYRADFLSIDIAPPDTTGAVAKWGRLSYNSDTGGDEFPYYNFSIWMNRERRLALFTATNVDGRTHDERPRTEFGKDKWVYDDRLPERLQIGNWFYGNEPERYNKNYFDRGHLTRRTEPSWGPLESARLANDDTFHWTNCTPQYKDFNQRSRHWQGIELYLLESGAIARDLRLTLFTGPVFSEDDTEHRGVLVPKQFFKVAVYVDREGQLHSAAYILDQSEWVDVIDFERRRTFDAKLVRRSVRSVESLTGLIFDRRLRNADAADSLGDDLAAIAALDDLFAT